MAKLAENTGYSIAAVSKLTGIGCHTLRVWERRYGFPVPRRSPSGHRRYAADHVQVLGQLAHRLREGGAIGDLMVLVRAGTLEVETEEFPVSAATSLSTAILDQLQLGDLARAEAAYERAVAGLSPAERAGQVIEPNIVEVGERWFRGEWNVFQEHYATSFFRRKLDVLLDQAQADNRSPSRTALVGTVQGDRHVGGVLMICLYLELAGWRAQQLGVDLPVREYQLAVDLWKPDAVCLSFVLSRNVNKRFAELARIRGAPVFVGGRSILNYQGLARRNGLRPIIGAADEATAQVIAAVEREVCEKHASHSPL
ncbi:MAG: regulatory protein MerR [Planctomycetota bacterium]|nr:regulatory protein MerR [Planctomycetota bacterium]